MRQKGQSGRALLACRAKPSCAPRPERARQCSATSSTLPRWQSPRSWNEQRVSWRLHIIVLREHC